MDKKMKKTLFVVAVAAIAMTACTNEKNEYVGSGSEQKEIALMPLAQASTRSGAQSGTFPTSYNMYVAAYQTSPTPAGNYFGRTKFTNVSTTNTWSGGQYWPLGTSTLNFLAITEGPGSSDTGTLNPDFDDTNYANVVTMAMTDNRPAEGVQHDLMWAVGQQSVTGSAGGPYTFSNVSMVFQHAQSWVNFTAKSNTADVVKLTSITLNGAYYSGTLTVTNTNYATTPSVENTTHVWNVTSESTQNVVVPNWTGASTALTTSETPVGDGLMIVPPTDAAAFSSFTIAYQVKRPATDTWDNYTYTYTPTTPTDRKLSQGYKYTYNISINLHEIIIEPTVAGWGSTSAVDVTVQ